MAKTKKADKAVELLQEEAPQPVQKVYYFDASQIKSLADVQIFAQLVGLRMTEAGYNNCSDLVKHYFTEANS